MIKPVFSLGRLQFHRRLLIQSLMVSTLSLVGVVSGVTVNFLGGVPTGLYTATAQAQSVSDKEVTDYARTVLTLELDRQQAYEEIKQKLGTKEVPEIVCSQADSIKNLPSDVRPIAVNYCNNSKRIVESNDLTITRFNALTVMLQNDPSLKQRVEAEMLRLQ
jgi:hypothetical protein